MPTKKKNFNDEVRFCNCGTMLSRYNLTITCGACLVERCAQICGKK